MGPCLQLVLLSLFFLIECFIYAGVLTGFTGSKGMQGARGMKGTAGEAGVPGEKGDTGPAGPKGESFINNSDVTYRPFQQLRQVIFSALCPKSSEG